MRTDWSLKVCMLAKKWGPVVVVAMAMAVIVFSLAGSETAYAGLRWSGLD